MIFQIISIRNIGTDSLLMFSLRIPHPPYPFERLFMPISSACSCSTARSTEVSVGGNSISAPVSVDLGSLGALTNHLTPTLGLRQSATLSPSASLA